MATTKRAARPTPSPHAGPSVGSLAELPPPSSEAVLYLVDLSGYVFRAYHAIAPLSSSRGEPTHAVMGTLNMLQKVINDRRPALLAVAMDSKGPTFRNELDPHYKANRPPPPPDLSQQMTRCEQMVRAYNIPIFQHEGVEADDVIATAVKSALEGGLSVVIVSADKDLMQLVRDGDRRVLLWDSMRDKVYGPDEVLAKFGVRPSMLRDLLALTGDSSDNIPGVPGVGPKTAAELLIQFSTLEGIYDNLDQVKKTKLRESLASSAQNARLSQRLVTLRDDVPIAWDIDLCRRAEPNDAELRRLFVELDFSRMLDQLKSPVPMRPAYGVVLTTPELERVARGIEETGLLGFDTETTSLDPTRAALVGLSLSSRPGDGVYVPIAHRYLGAPTQLAWDEVKSILLPLFRSTRIKKNGHNVKFDEIVLRRHGVELDGLVFDTMIASYLLDPETSNGLKELARRELGITMITYDEVTRKQRGTQLRFDQVAIEDAAPYAAADAEVSVTLAERFEERVEREGLGALMREVEMPLSRVLVQMELAGVMIDLAHLEQLGRRIEGQLRALEATAKHIAGRDFSVRSRDQLESILFDELKLPVVKRTPKGGRSTDAEVLEELADRHPLCRAILEFRELDKLKGTYIDALPRAVNPETGRIHTQFSQTTAATGRLASSDPNLQNIPIRTELGREIRAAFIAPAGHSIVSADYSQIELRLLAHLSGDPELLEAFRSGQDVHTRTAMLIFDVAKEAVTSEMRRRAKTINFGVIYGMGDAALAKALGIARDEAARFIEAYFTRYAGVARFMEQTVEAARRGEAVRTLLGRRRFLPNLHSAHRGLRLEAERVAKNTPIQGTAADILKVAMVTLGRAPVTPGARMILTVHDELVFEVPRAEVGAATAVVKEAMQSAMTLDVPLVVEVGVGDNWALAH